jgi:DNA-binding MarR family transcriptional regulator
MALPPCGLLIIRPSVSEYGIAGSFLVSGNQTLRSLIILPSMDLMTPKNNELAEHLADLTYELLENCQIKIERTARKLNLTVAEFKLLRCLCENEKVAAGELARRLGLSSSRLTRIIDGLVAKSVVRKSIGGKDRRVVDIELTPEGVEVRNQLKLMYVTVHQDIINLLPTDAGESVVHAMEKLRSATHEWIKK